MSVIGISCIAQDFRFALRTLRKSPGFSIVAILTLALGIGANVTIFTLGHAILLRPMPGIQDPDRLVRLLESDGDVSYPNFRVYRDRAQSLSDTAATLFTTAVLGGGKAVSAELVSDSYFRTLRVEPVLGRAIAAGDKEAAVISSGLWARQFGNDPQVLRRTLRVNGREYTIVGVGPYGFRGFELFSSTDVWIPAAMFREFAIGFPGTNVFEEQVRIVSVVARLRDGVQASEALAELRTIAAQLTAADPVKNKNLAVDLVKDFSIVPEFRRDLTNLLFVLTSLAAMVLLIATANLVNLLLARATARRAEIAIRLSLGATRWVVARQLIIESLTLSSLGAVAAVVIASWLGSYLLTLSGEVPFEATTDWRVITFTALLALGTGVLMGAVYAMQPGFRILRSGLVVAQITLALGLVGVCGLLTKTMMNANRVDVGFSIDTLIGARIDLRSARYPEERARVFYDRLLQTTDGALASSPPVSSWVWTAKVAAESKTLEVGKLTISHGYFRTLNVPLRSGREFLPTDRASAPAVAIVNESLARQFWGSTSAEGRTVDLVSPLGSKPARVVGVVKDLLHTDPFGGARPWIYIPLAQHHEPEVILHVQGAARAVVEQAIQSLDPDVATPQIWTAKEIFREVFYRQRLLAWNSAAFGMVALLMATLGVYGVVAYSVAQRMREYGIRIALGADTADIRRLVLRQAAMFAAIGIPAGVALAIAGSQVVKAYLLGVTAVDPMPLAIAAGILLLATLLAAYVPARRAMGVDPAEALRYE